MSENLLGLTIAADKGLDDLQCQRLLSENRRYQEVMPSFLLFFNLRNLLYLIPPFLSASIVSADAHHGKCANENLPKSEYGSLLNGCRR